MNSELVLTKHRNIFDRRSLAGALAVVAVLSFFGFGLQMIDDALRSASGFDVGQPFQVSPTVAFTPADGWVIDSKQTVPDVAVVARKNGWEMKLSGLQLGPGQTVEDFAAIFRDPDDASTQLTDLVTFTTTSGLHGVSWEEHGPTSANLRWLVYSGQEMAQLLADGADSTLASVEAELQSMAESITLTGAGGTAG